jgi:outer membrane cobalamin receptor
LPKSTRDNNSIIGAVSLKKELNFIEFEQINSARIDYVSDMSKYSSVRFELNSKFFFIYPISIRSNFGNSFMLPSFYELYYKGDTQTAGNPDLLPEKSHGYRIESEIETNPTIIVAYWFNKTENLIYWNRSIYGWKPFNISSSEIINYEISSKFEFLENQFITFDYNKINAKNKTKNSYLYNKNIVYTPDYRCNIGLNLEIKNFSQKFSCVAIGKQWTTLDQLITPLRQYQIYNSQSSFVIKNNYSSIVFLMTINNLLNKIYENYSFTPEAGRYYEFSVGVNF